MEQSRLSDRISDSGTQMPHPVWRAIELRVEKVRGLKPFDQIRRIDDPNFVYLQSRHYQHRFEILNNHERFRADLSATEAAPEYQGLGPVEQEIVAFARLQKPHIAMLVGGMGGGKTTTLQWVEKHVLKDIVIKHCDLEGVNLDDGDSPTAIADLLASHIAIQIHELIPPSEELTDAWNWAFDADGGDHHGAKYILAPAQTLLRRELGDDWRNTTEEAMALRRRAHTSITLEPARHLTYLALLLDYYLTVKCLRKRHQFMLVLDNVDPLSPRLQYELYRCVSKFQEAAQCKVMVAMRPLTYYSKTQGASKTVNVIEQIGPHPLELIVSRAERLILDTDMSDLRVRVVGDSQPERLVGETEAKAWICEVLEAVRHQLSAPRGEGGLRPFFEGICNHSLRSALVAAPKLFGSSAVPFSLDTRQPNSSRHKPHELLRALLIGPRHVFIGSDGRITDNVFDLGRRATHTSPTCKVRLLRRLNAEPNHCLVVSELRDHLQMFGYSDGAILDAVNSVIAHSKRLCWSDSLAYYESFADAPASKLYLAGSGKYYVNNAIYSLEYVQETHVDTPLPLNILMKSYSPGKFTDRITSLRLFLGHFADLDIEEVSSVLARGIRATREYGDVYGDDLLSIGLSRAIGDQVVKIGRAMLAGRAGQRFQSEIEEALTPWSGFGDFVALRSSAIVRKIQELRAL